MSQYKITGKRKFNPKDFFLQWEWMLVLLFILVNIVNTNLSPYYLNIQNLVDATMSFLDRSFMVLPMAIVIILGEIDVSVASTVALSSVIMASVYDIGAPMPFAMVVCLAVGAFCGLINGIIITRFKELSSTIVTLSTSIIYRGAAYIILEDQSIGNFPTWFNKLGWGYLGKVPIILLAFAVFAVIYGIALHATTFGRRIYAMGNNITASRYSGISTDRIKTLAFTLNGLMAGITSIFLTSRMGSTRPNIAIGYELEVIAMVVLGGVSATGGRGRIIGTVISVFLVGYLRYGLGLVNVPSQILLIINGLLLIFAVMIPNLQIGKKFTRKKASADK